MSAAGSAVVRTPLEGSCVIGFNSPRSAINPVAIDHGSEVGISPAFGVVLLSQSDFEIGPRSFVCPEHDAIERNPFVVNMIALQRFQKQVDCVIFGQRML